MTNVVDAASLAAVTGGTALATCSEHSAMSRRALAEGRPATAAIYDGMASSCRASWVREKWNALRSLF